ncbi:two-component sensor histidine kinase [Herminiimonas sp. KBW02]|uniref:cache domain-containing protein n=1 Tax=Herminiimonas sp. KBW02 TaxID=2153363 RepID=UPI000F5AFB92|nr:cache domain-containing protein [Herminiimonas sp. KBW02]RQO37193.1 two-component sensor histidine kinase [Herminiimonas sp. KBW02]
MQWVATRHILGNVSVRTKLLLVALVPILTALPIIFSLIFYWGLGYYDRLLTFKVSSDLTVAHEYFIHVRERIGQDVSSLGDSYRFVTTVRDDNNANLQRMLAEKQKSLDLDFLNFLDPQGRVIVSSNGKPAELIAESWPVVYSALQGEKATEIDIYSEEQLRQLSDKAAQQAYTELLNTSNAAPTKKTAEKSGMVIHSATPVYDDDGKLLGVLEGGMLLNQNLSFVDTINSLVYAEGSLPEGSAGTATLFIDDVRIATNVRLFGNKRALGTRASQIVRDHVLNDGKTWLDRAFVVHDWYISAYEPISDSFGKRVGMLYVGYLEEPFRKAKETAIILLALLFIAIGIGGAYFSLRVARSIYEPLKGMNRTMTAVEQGDMDARTGGDQARDELGNLSRHLDELLDTVQEQNAELKTWGNELDRKVVERTAELQQTNKLLVQAQQQLVLAEKLAAIGEITAGVAHEINNPVAVLQGNLDVLRDTLGPAIRPVQGELQLMDQQIYRINTIVTKLLQFASPGEFAGYVEAINIDEVVADSLVLVRHLLNQSRIIVVHKKEATLSVPINRGELQQVLINLCTNAIHAMKDGGKLTITTSDWEEENGARGVLIRVEDTGSGIRKEDIAHIFDAFFTTKRQGGTGLGLSISYTLVARYGGTITVRSEPGQGTEFTVRLLA